MKKKVKYKTEYIKWFDLTEADFIVDEYEYIVNRKIVKATQIHHILFGKDKFDAIENWMALSVDNHTKAHQEKHDRYYLRKVHLEFMFNNPY